MELKQGEKFEDKKFIELLNQIHDGQKKDDKIQKSFNSENIDENSFLYISTQKDFKNLLKSCFENAITLFLDSFPNLITLYFINNHATQIEASGFGLGLAWSNFIAQGIFCGLSSGFEILATQTYGSGNYQIVGLLFQRTVYVNLILFIPISFVIFYTQNILSYWNHDEELCRKAAFYCICSLPGLLLSTISFPIKALMNAQNIRNLLYKYVSWIIPFHYIVSYLFLSVLDLKILGAALVFSLTQFGQIAIIYFIVKRNKKYQQCLIPFNKQCMKDIFQFLKIVVPIGSIMTLEWFAYETYSIVASNLIPAQYSAHIVFAQFNVLYNQISDGYSIATSTTVGNLMGRNNPNDAKKLAKYGLIIAFFYVLITLIPIYLLKYRIINMFSVDKEAEEHLISTFNIFMIQALLDCLQIMISGLMKAIGKEIRSIFIFIACYVTIGIFSADFLAFHLGLELKGIWIGAIIGVFQFQIFLFLQEQLYKLYTSDWSKLTLNIQERIESQSNVGDLDMHETFF